MNFALPFEFNELVIRFKSFLVGFCSGFFGFRLIKDFFQGFNLLASASRIVDFEINNEVGTALQISSFPQKIILYE